MDRNTRCPAQPVCPIARKPQWVLRAKYKLGAGALSSLTVHFGHSRGQFRALRRLAALRCSLSPTPSLLALIRCMRRGLARSILLSDTRVNPFS
jgi:hypothetical protein